MTIAAGFCLQDGILLVADTMYSGGTKIHQPKLFGHVLNPNTPESTTLAFALAGHEDNGKMAIEDCVDEVRSIAPIERTLLRVRKALRKSVGSIYAGYVDARPENERATLDFQLVIGAWLPMAGGLKMFRTNGPAVVPATEKYYCTGVGKYLGDYLMRDALDPSMSCRDAALLAIRAVSAAKDYDCSCGGDTQFMRILPGGELTTVVEYDVKGVEGYIRDFDKASRTLLFNLGTKCMTLTDEPFHRALGSFDDEIRSIRAFWNGQGFAYLADLFDKLKAKDQ